VTRRSIVVAGALLVAGSAAMALLLAGAGHTSTAAAAKSPVTTIVRAPQVGLGPTTERAGMPVGFGPDQRGAERAAMVFASASQRWLYFDDAGVEAAVRAISTSSSGNRLAAAVLDQVRATRESLLLASRAWWVVRPLAYRVDRFDGDTARVAVWVVTVLSATDVAAPQADWRTVTFELRRERGDWRVHDVEDAAGPTPDVGPRDRPWSAARLDDALDGFTRVEVGQL
jgi:hypothetical protein